MGYTDIHAGRIPTHIKFKNKNNARCGAINTITQVTEAGGFLWFEASLVYISKFQVS